jgi:hypothetical protein
LFRDCSAIVPRLFAFLFAILSWAVTGKAALGNAREQADIRTLRYGEPIAMKAYLITTGTVFGLITLAHICRIYVEGAHLAKEPVFLLLTLAAAALSLWAWLLLRWSSRP